MVRVVEPVTQEQQFFEGEPDLEPPEELAVAELDEESLLEEELDNDDIGEEEVDDEVLTASLEVLIHMSDDADGDAGGDRDEDTDGAPANRNVLGLVILGVADRGPDEDEDEDDELEALEVDDLEDLEESLDRLLEERLGALESSAADGSGGAEEDGDGHGHVALPSPASASVVVIDPAAPGCRMDEFVCRGCFLVRLRSQLADPTSMLCRDCRN